MSSDSKEIVEIKEEPIDEPVDSVLDQPATDDILDLTNPIRDSKEIVEDKKEPLDGPVDSVSDQPATDDILDLTNPIRDYEEFNSWRADLDGVPPCQFRIKSVRYLKQQNMELKAPEFLVPELEPLAAQIKCTVNDEHFRLWIAFRKPCGPMITEFDPRFNPMVTTTLVANDADFKLTFCHVFSFALPFFYGKFHTIFKLPYRYWVNRITNISNNKDSLTLSFVVKNGILPDLPAPVEGPPLLWKVDVSRLDLRAGVYFESETQMGLSPFIRAHESSTLKVQLRLFVRGLNVEAERRFFNEQFELFRRMKSVVSLGFVRPDCPGTPLNVVFEEIIDFPSEKSAKFSVLFSIDKLITLISENTLRLDVGIREILA